MKQTVDKILALWQHGADTAPERIHIERLLSTFAVSTVKYGVIRVAKKFRLDPSMDATSRGKYLSSVCRTLRENTNVRESQRWIPAAWLAQQ
jgi:hypothetical protein